MKFDLCHDSLASHGKEIIRAELCRFDPRKYQRAFINNVHLVFPRRYLRLHGSAIMSDKCSKTECSVTIVYSIDPGVLLADLVSLECSSQKISGEQQEE